MLVRSIRLASFAARGSPAERSLPASNGADPDRVAKAIEHALTARRPKSRYLIGRDARILVGLSSVLTARAFGSLVERDMGLPRKAPNAD